MLIINADDFGLNERTNAAIVNCFEKGLCSSTTIMANMPGFDEACRTISKYGLNEHVGLHIVLTEGVPLTDKIKQQRRFCDERGVFRSNTREKRLFHLSADEKETVGEEIRSQIERCRKNGLKLTHVDSHHHIHEEKGVLEVIIPLMQEFGIPYIRIMCNLAESCSIIRRTYIVLYNNYLKHCGLSRTHYFGSIDQYIAFKKKHSQKNTTGKVFEIMTHPITNDNGAIVDMLNQRPMEQLIEEAGFNRKAESFSGAVYTPPLIDLYTSKPNRNKRIESKKQSCIRALARWHEYER